ncbi:hypothetical protein [Polaribacter sp. IC073]|uniref:hypothetical protein n=1 Tax=Polaribacter sp. IC073 TaxID=2508540 RepID=UPI0011BDC251|nr:hypothetical protein [Polaribacter sp. IC073]TXD49158.1 hypothetical protein ES045_03580 [Polaribacter sp. IC073]
MKINKLDNNIKEKFANRTLEPSVSAWERLSVQLDNQPKQKKKGWFLYIGYAASILALVSIGVYTFSSDKKNTNPKEVIVEGVVDTIQVLNKIEEHFNEIPVERAIVEKEVINKEDNKVENKQEKKAIAYRKAIIIPTKEDSVELNKNLRISRNIDKGISKKTEKISTLNKEINTSRIKVSAEALLFAVTNAPEEESKPYMKNNVSSAVLLETIKIELKKSNLKVNPETILAEVKRTISDDDFQNNFLKSLKKKITNIATAIASRND